MKRKVFAAIMVAAVLSVLSSMSAFAQGWEKAENKWRYFQEDGTVAKNMWIDTDGGPFGRRQ